jgi:hypothetical protein
VFVPKATINSNCDSFMDFQSGTPTAPTLQLYLLSNDTVAFGATYTATQLLATPVTGCTMQFSRGDASVSDARALNYVSYAGGAACAPNACLTSGLNFVSEASGNLALMSRSSDKTLACNGYAGTVTSASSGTMSLHHVLTAGSAVSALSPPATATFTGATLTSTIGACNYTFALGATSAAAQSAPKAALALAVGAAVAALF